MLAPLVVVCGVLAALVAIGLNAASGGQNYAGLGLSSPGALTEDGLPAVRALADVAAVLCVGALLAAGFLVPPKGKRLSGHGYAAIRAAGLAAIVWCVAALLCVPLTISDSVGQPLSEVLRPANFGVLFGALQQAKAWLVTAVIVFVVALGCRLVLSAGWSAALFFLALLGLSPIAATGHSSAGGDHDIATDSLLFHLVAASIWIGGLVALLGYALRGGDRIDVVTRRFSATALICWIVMAISGVLNALVRLPVHDLFRTGYGALVLGKIAALLGLGVLGYLQRRRGVVNVLRRGDARALITFGAIESLLMFATIGLAVALGHTSPPADAARQVSTVELLIGYDLAGPPTAARLAFDWRFDLVFGTAAIVLAVVYLLGVRRLRAAGVRWPIGRTVGWLAGCAVLLLATSSGVGRYAPAMFSVHLGGQLALTTFAPVLFALGGPITLLARALPRAADTDRPPGPREWLLALAHSPMARFLTHPVVAFALFSVFLYALYLTGLFDAALQEHWAHLVMNACSLLIGYVFFWPIIGVDSAPHSLTGNNRVIMVLGALVFQVLFGVLVMNSSTIIGSDFYRSLSLSWLDPTSEQHIGGGIAWACGEMPLVIVLVL
ncbi:MAG: bifunctional copper resistance protein CopD/cytochrome c oxidase assembly protein, partial [Sciscionella sp.]|nr:bifunctional copper resistance protein CopD/cytochrome c oxidase assembly protein [Sciscionella sp.]